jgi:tetratricopeptide (TPR) repeat protein
VSRHLVAAGQIIDEDSELALKHAIAARRLASRIAVVREAVGLAAYAAGDWTTAIAELRTYHRMTGRQTHLPELADCERALGRPERAIDLYRGADMEALDKAGAIELLIVAAGARGDLGQHDAAVAMLQVRELTSDDDAEWSARLRYAYADALLAAGRREEAREWFARAAAVDEDQLTDAAERLLELDGVTIEGDEDEADAADTDLNTDPLDGQPQGKPDQGGPDQGGPDQDGQGDEPAYDEFEDDDEDDDEEEDRDGEPYDAFQDDVDRDVEDGDEADDESGELAGNLRADDESDADDDDEDDEDGGPVDEGGEGEDDKAQDDAFIAEAEQKRPQA